jgi:hypothetical protein
MGGGNWDSTDLPVLPGFFMNFEAAATASISGGIRGVVLMPVRARWGPVGKFKTITKDADIKKVYTYDVTNGANAYTLLHLCLLGAPKQILSYRLADANASAASITLRDTTAAPVDVMTLTTKYETDLPFKATVQTNPIDATKKDIKIYLDSTLLFTTTVASGSIQDAVDAVNSNPSNIHLNAAFVAAGNGVLANISSQSLTGGNAGNSAITASEYTDFMDAAETQKFNYVCLDAVTDESIQTSFNAWVKRLRGEGAGIKGVAGGTAANDIASDAVTLAVSRSAGFNYEGMINVGNGGKLDGVSYSSAQTACYVAGLCAGTKLAGSTTYAATPFDDVNRRWTRSEQEAAIKGGVFIFVYDGSIVKPLRGINTLTTLGDTQNNQFKKIRAINTMDVINSDLLTTAEKSYIGKINNSDEGRLALVGACKAYMETMVKAGVIDDEFDVYLNPDYYGDGAELTPAADQVFICWSAYITDVMEQIFGRFIVQSS